MSKEINNLKIAYSFFGEVKELDPLNVNDIYKANLLENLYVRLLEYDNDGNLSCNLCTEYYVIGNELRFKIRDDIKTIDGFVINVNDVESSLKRLVKAQTNSHGELKIFLDSNNGIYSDGDYLVLKMKNQSFVKFILPILTSMDYSIIPNESINNKNEIFDYRNTSGPYYVESEEEEKIILKANPNNINFDKNMPQLIEVIKTSNHEAIEKLVKNEVDLIDVTMYPRSSIYKEFFEKNHLEFSEFKTLPMNLFYVGISKKARKNFKKDELFYACRVIKNTYSSFNTFGYGYQDAYQFFQGSGNGQLDEDELQELIKIREKESVFTNEKRIKFGVLSRSFEKIKTAMINYKNIEVVSYEDDPAFLPPESQPDLYIQTTDSSFTEDINVLSYNLNNENFGLDKKEKEIWFNEYLSLEDKEDRIQKIKDLQKDFLNAPVLCPLVISPYWAISKKDLSLNFPTQFPGSHWWKIRKL